MQKTQGLVLGGLKVSYVDFVLYELMQASNFISEGKLFSTYPVIAFYSSLVENLPRLKEFIQSSPNCLASYSFFSPLAAINNWPVVNWKKPSARHALDFGKSHLSSYTKGQLTKPILGYWAIRGLGQGIRYQLKYLGADFDDKGYSDSDQWFKDDK